MPESPEFEAEKLHEAIHEEMHHEQTPHHTSFLKRVALTTALLAGCAAITAFQAGGTINEALALKTDATREQAMASDQWAFFQAKGVKSAASDAAEAAFVAAGKTPPATYEEKRKRYEAEQEVIKEKALEHEKERDAKVTEADHLLHQHHKFSNAVALFQVAIALGALAALTRNKPVWIGSLLLGAGGIAFFVMAYMP